jgi:hypothetical protein
MGRGSRPKLRPGAGTHSVPARPLPYSLNARIAVETSPGPTTVMPDGVTW